MDHDNKAGRHGRSTVSWYEKYSRAPRYTDLLGRWEQVPDMLGRCSPRRAWLDSSIPRQARPRNILQPPRGTYLGYLGTLPLVGT